MAEGLIFQRENTHHDPEVNRRGCWKRGMPVVIFQDGHEWGRHEKLLNWMEEGKSPLDWPEHFYLFKWPNVDADVIRHFFELQTDTDAGIILPRGQYHRRRKYCVDIDQLPVNNKAELIAQRETSFVGDAGMLAFEMALVRVGTKAPYLTPADIMKRIA